MIREINSRDLAEFCKRLTRDRKGAAVKLETIESDGAKNTLAGNAVLESISFARADGCSDAITLRARSEREIVHEMIDPIRVQLHPSHGGAGDFNTLQIESESGVTTLTLHPPVHAQMLDGLKTG